MNEYEDENPEYWEDYNNLQRVKHELLRYYLGGWFFILSKWSQIVYIDCHAGRGKHEGGQIGSPLIALETLLNHKELSQILRSCEIRFFFIEADIENKQTLEANLAKYNRPAKVSVAVECADFQSTLQKVVDELNERRSSLPPAFVFVDPYGFKLPGKLLAQLKAFEKCELFITFMWRWIDMAIRNPAHEKNMDALFVTPEWRTLLNIADPEERCEAAIRLLSKQLGGKYLTRVKMLGDHGEIKYVLMHSSGHSKGRELMLQAMWKICPTGQFKVRVNDNPDQEYLFDPGPDLQPLKDWLWERYRGKSVSIKEIYADMEHPTNGTFYLKTHLHLAIKELLKSREIIGPDKIVFSKNPKLQFPKRPTTPR